MILVSRKFIWHTHAKWIQNKIYKANVPIVNNLQTKVVTSLVNLYSMQVIKQYEIMYEFWQLKCWQFLFDAPPKKCPKCCTSQLRQWMWILQSLSQHLYSVARITAIASGFQEAYKQKWWSLVDQLWNWSGMSIFSLINVPLSLTCSPTPFWIPTLVTEAYRIYSPISRPRI